MGTNVGPVLSHRWNGWDLVPAVWAVRRLTMWGDCRLIPITVRLILLSSLSMISCTCADVGPCRRNTAVTPSPANAAEQIRDTPGSQAQSREAEEAHQKSNKKNPPSITQNPRLGVCCAINVCDSFLIQILKPSHPMISEVLWKVIKVTRVGSWSDSIRVLMRRDTRGRVCICSYVLCLCFMYSWSREHKSTQERSATSLQGCPHWSSVVLTPWPETFRF